MAKLTRTIILEGDSAWIAKTLERSYLNGPGSTRHCGVGNWLWETDGRHFYHDCIECQFQGHLVGVDCYWCEREEAVVLHEASCIRSYSFNDIEQELHHPGTAAVTTLALAVYRLYVHALAVYDEQLSRREPCSDPGDGGAARFERS